MSKLRVAIVAPPWLKVPPNGYGGIEVVLDGLIDGLKKNKEVDFELFNIGETDIPGVKNHFLYQDEQYKHIHKPIYESIPIISAHVQSALNFIKSDGGFDVVHDHNGYLGPQIFGLATQDPKFPPVIHTHHGPPFSTKQTIATGQPDNTPFWKELVKLSPRFYIVGISNTLLEPAPRELKKHILPAVYNAIDVEKFKYKKDKENYFYIVSRFSREKGQHIAAKLCTKLGYELRMAGSVAGITSTKQLLLELSNPLSSYRNAVDFRYYSDEILPLTIHNKKINNFGDVSGIYKQNLITNAKALLFPIQWDEPFGMVVIEAMACGTPVVAMNRGAMPEIIKHGVNGYLADTEEEFTEYMQKVDEINPEDCRRSVEENFSAEVMATRYVERYKEVVRIASKKS